MPLERTFDVFVSVRWVLPSTRPEVFRVKLYAVFSTVLRAVAPRHVDRFTFLVVLVRQNADYQIFCACKTAIPQCWKYL